MENMDTMIANLINGNLSDAKKQAERYSHFRIREYLETVSGKSEQEAIIIADVLKGFIAFHEYFEKINCLKEVWTDQYK